MKIARQLFFWAVTAVISLAAFGLINQGGPKGPVAKENFLQQAVLYEVNIRQYTEAGTFAAFQKELPRLKQLGVDILWLMPIHPISETNRKGTLGSYYSISDYKKVNPEFGTDEDFRALVDKAHELGFAVILDWVANHTGYDHPWITQHSDWYTQNLNGEIVPPEGTDWTDVADLNYKNKELWNEMVASMDYWVSTFGIDGFRADAAGMVPQEFWEFAQKKLEERGTLFLLAEDSANQELLEETFDANYNWPMLSLMNQSVSEPMDARLFRRNLDKIFRNYRQAGFPLNFITNHDENSWNGTEYERLGEGVEAFTALTFTVPGMPMIYSGQEAGFNRRLAFFEKDQIDFKPSPMTELYKNLATLKDKNPALWNLNQENMKFLPTSSKQAIGFIRTEGDNTVVMLLNVSPNQAVFEMSFGEQSYNLYSFEDGSMHTFTGNQEFTLQPWGYQIFSSEPVG